MNLLQQFTHIHSVTVNSSQGRDGGAPVPACSRPTVKAFVLPDSPCYVYWSSLCLPCSTGISFCVHACAEALRVFILVAVFFWSFRFAKRVFRKNPFSPQGELRLISTCWESMRHLAVKLKPKNSREVISFYRSNFTHNEGFPEGNAEIPSGESQERSCCHGSSSRQSGDNGSVSANTEADGFCCTATELREKYKPHFT